MHERRPLHRGNGPHTRRGRPGSPTPSSPMLIHGLYVRDMAGLDLTLLRTYLAAERGRSG